MTVARYNELICIFFRFLIILDLIYGNRLEGEGKVFTITL